METSARDCDVCFDPIPMWDQVRFLCTDKCPAVLCHDCAANYFTHCASEIIPGLVVKINCPVCVRPMPLARWAPLHNEAAEYVETSTYKASEVRCPNCDQSTAFLSSYHESPDPLMLVPTLKQKLPWLRRLTRKFCRYKIAASALHQYIFATFGDKAPAVASHVLALLDDPERHTSFGLLHLQHMRNVRTPCCDQEICFACKSTGHDGDCDVLHQEFFNHVITCPQCGIALVRGDGCDSMKCVCDAYFTWTERVDVAVDEGRAMRMAALARLPRGFDCMRQVIEFCRHVVWKRRFRAPLDEMRVQKHHPAAWRTVCEWLRRQAWRTKYTDVVRRCAKTMRHRMLLQELLRSTPRVEPAAESCGPLVPVVLKTVKGNEWGAAVEPMAAVA
ncbi:Aste57867_8529 [Aphanomyces stellatus]|uniref:Aste57867_8529 protein n=1 Tax=Aphanomyces stellatus TaxID=120398 RepID=A0A485KKI5_9STRA|nr:hypothetical protein As57867_008497 [Aphanomyces stellatus]VFT85415.1 Aste57867_8529 [Aphanomyces stellatus]